MNRVLDADGYAVCVEGFLCYIKTRRMKKKYSSALGTKYASFGFSKEALDRVASQRVETIANEDEIDGDVASPTTLLLLMKEMQGSNDVLRTKVTQTQKELDNLKTTQQTKVDEPENPLAKELAEMKAMMTAMATEVAESKKKARNEAIIKDVHAKMKEMGCSNEFIRTATLQSMEISDTDTADALAEKYKSEYDKNCKSAFGNGYVPPKGNNAGEGGEIDFGGMVEGLKKSGAIPK